MKVTFRILQIQQRIKMGKGNEDGKTGKRKEKVRYT
jgi:hypothetical protein